MGLASPWQVTSLEALRQSLHCLDTENAIAALESAGHENMAPRAEITRLFLAAPRRIIRATKALEFESGSGNETIVKVRLRQLGYRVTAQGYVPGLGHQDLVVEDCVGLDLDGRRWHGEDRFAIDRDRDLLSEGLGRRALRLRHAHIHESWPQTLSVIERAVADTLALRRLRTGPGLPG
jgi:hypothetical protein